MRKLGILRSFAALAPAQDDVFVGHPSSFHRVISTTQILANPAPNLAFPNSAQIPDLNLWTAAENR
jgi:hypothetical protein